MCQDNIRGNELKHIELMISENTDIITCLQHFFLSLSAINVGGLNYTNPPYWFYETR